MVVPDAPADDVPRDFVVVVPSFFVAAVPLVPVLLPEGEAVAVGVAFTFTMQEAEMPLPSFAVTVITAEPALTPFTFPFLVTVATFLLEEDHFTSLLVALDGDATAVSFFVFPFTTVMEL